MVRIAIAVFVLVALGFAAPVRAQTAPVALAYSEATPGYRFYPGDQIEISVFSAPELSRTVTVGPDGRIALPMIPPVRAADLSAAELHDALVAAYATQLRTPELDVTAKAFGSRQVFVTGEVAHPGVYEMPADMDAFQAITLAGGFLPTARRGEVLILSRAPGAAAHVVPIDLSNRALRAGFPNATPLNRYDVVYAPRSRIAQINQFMQQYVRDALPIQFSLYYDLNPASRP